LFKFGLTLRLKRRMFTGEFVLAQSSDKPAIPNPFGFRGTTHRFDRLR